MKKVLYAKYNRTRVPKYQTVTKIIEQEGKRHVIKEALLDEAEEHVSSMAEKCKRLTDIYTNIEPCGCCINNGVVTFDYYKGQSVADIIESDMDSLDEVLVNIGKYADMLFKYNDKYVFQFRNSEVFENIFGIIKELEGISAVNGADIDLIFDNVFLADDKYVCIDYEWFIDCLIPVEFIKYRALYYFYAKNHAYFHNKMDVKGFLQYYGIDEKMQVVYKGMDDSFQQMVHGKNWVNIYTRNYEKKIHAIKDLLHQYSDIERTIDVFNNTLVQMNDELRRSKEEVEHIRYEYQVLMDKKASMIRDKDYEISRLKKINSDNIILINNNNERLSTLGEKYNRLEEDLEASNNRLESIEKSISWKLTKPIRIISDFMQGKR